MENKIFKENFSVNPRIYKTINFKDHRGSFDKIFSKELLSFLKNYPIRLEEINHCYTKKKGTLRGMHFQIGRYKEDKIITCLKGKIFDVVVDLRKKSKNFLKWKSFILNENSNKSLFIPKGFAHGYQSITNDTEILYFVTSKYSPKHEKGINPLSDFLNIKWPIKKKIISDKDIKLPKLESNFKGF